MNESYPKIALNVTLLLFVMLAFLTITPDHDWGGDFSEYITQAISITEGDFRPLGEGAPVSPYSNYPWGTGALLAPVYAVFGFNILALKLVNVVSYLLLLVLVWCARRQTLPDLYRLSLVLLLAVHPVFLRHMTYVLSDIPALLLATAAVMMLRHTEVERGGLFSKTVDASLVGLLIAMACTVRSSCLILLVALAACQLLKMAVAVKKGNPGITCILSSLRAVNRQTVKTFALASLPYCLPYVVFVLFMSAWQLLFPESSTPFASTVSQADSATWFDQLQNHGIVASVKVRQAVDQGVYYWDMAPFIFNGHAVIFYLSAPLAIWGIIKNRRHDYPFTVYIAGTIVMYLFYPGRQGGRYLFPIVPFYLYFVLCGVHAIYSVVAAKTRATGRVVAVALLVSVALLGGDYLADAVGQAKQFMEWNPQFGPYGRESLEMFQLVKDTTEPDDIVMFFKPRVMRLYSGRWSHLPFYFDTPVPDRDYYYVHCTAAELSEQGKIEPLLSDTTRFQVLQSNNWFTMYRMLQ